MADPFTPKFVDLVRNYTTTTGTGDLKLGPAVNGYTGLSTALQVGDCFYYSAIGVDKPTEREVGRGTLLSGGLISRDPIGGTKTNFTSGTKSVALIAAAEWFSSVQAGTGPAPAMASDRTTLAALSDRQRPAVLCESGREGLFLWDSANLSASVAADPAQALRIPPASDPSGASGAWVRKYSGPKNATWFGAVGDGSTDDSVALQRWLDSGGHLSLATREYYSSAKLIVRKFVVIEGEGYGFDSRTVDGTATLGYENQPGAKIKFPAGIGGLDIQPQTTETDVATAVAAGIGGRTQEGALYSRISNLAVIGAGTGPVATAVYSRTAVHLENVHVLKFQGKGFDISASSDIDDGNSEYGTASLSTLINCVAISNGSHGFHIRGRDANGLTLLGCTAQLNGGWGFLDDSLLGNSYIGGQAATNTLGSYKCIGGVAASAYHGCYVEVGTGQAPDLSYQCAVSGNYLASFTYQFNIGSNGNPTILSGRGVDTPQINLTKHQSATAVAYGNAKIYRGADRGLVLQGAPNDVAGAYDVTIVNNLDQSVMAVPRGTQTSRHFGPVQLDFSYVLLNGNAGFPGLIGTTGVVFSDAVNGATLCGFGGGSYDTCLANKTNQPALRVPAGTQNVEVVGSLSAAGVASTGAVRSTSGSAGLGYATGAGGTVTQATNKATGVTLDKVSGQITTHTAALAAAAIVEFTVTNAQVAATDTISLNLASGATTSTAYRYWISRVAAGSFRVCIENRSTGSLSEALVFNFAIVKAVAA